MADDLIAQYDALVAAGNLRSDPAQIAVLEALSGLETHLVATSERKSGILATLLTRKTPDAPKGLYLWGGVGAGKSMLMDLFFEATDIRRKRRVHFHAFMQEIHSALHERRREGLTDPIQPIAVTVADEARLLCFDEMQISDITDAMLVGRLFEALFKLGVTIVTTSNRKPDDLYLNGLNRQLFLPFIDLLKDRMTVHHLLTDTDYRQDRLIGQPVYFAPLGGASEQSLDEIWETLTEGEEAPHSLTVKSRTLILSRFHNGVARADFADLCEKPLGAADYIALTEAVRLLILENIPVMTRARNNEAKRFVTLIDTLYEAGTRLYCSAAAEPEALYPTGTGAFEFERTASRLREMQGAEWLSAER